MCSPMAVAVCSGPLPVNFRKGKTLIVIDPRKTELVKYANHHLQLRPGTNVALLNMMLYYIIKENLEYKDFIAARTEGYEDFRKNILNQHEYCGKD